MASIFVFAFVAAVLCNSVLCFVKTIYMTPELRHGLYAVDPKELGGEKYEAEREQDREKAKAR